MYGAANESKRNFVSRVGRAGKRLGLDHVFKRFDQFGFVII